MSFWQGNRLTASRAGGSLVKHSSVLSLLLILVGVSNTLNASEAKAAAPFDILAPGSSLVKASEQDASLHPIVLSSIKRVSNSLRVERQTNISGVRQNYLYKLADKQRLDGAKTFYRELLVKQGDLEFQCEERSCGSSNDWANKVFAQRNLAGRDSNQSYFAGQLDDGLHQGWLSVYAVTNARREHYVYVSFVPAPPRDIVADAKRGVLYEQDNLSAKDIEQLAAALSDNGLSVSLTVFSKQATLSFAENRSASQEMGGVLATKLAADLGIDTAKIEVVSMGSLGQSPIGLEVEQWCYLYLHD